VRASFVVVFLRQASGTYLAVDESQVERLNIGMSGPNKAYRNVQTVLRARAQLAGRPVPPGSALQPTAPLSRWG
jgi:hypothetical protein